MALLPLDELRRALQMAVPLKHRASENVVACPGVVLRSAVRSGCVPLHRDRLRSCNKLPTKPGAEDRIRTDDLLITNELLYQLSYFGVLNKVIRREKTKSFKTKTADCISK